MGLPKYMLGSLFFFTVLDILECYSPSGFDDSKSCQSNAHVCTSLMKYPDETVFNEGPYCQCSGCHGDWKTDDWKALSWPHYERADQIVQYRFCIPIIPKRECDDDDLAITIETETGKWNPHVRDARCACPYHMYQLLGWWRHPTQKHDNKTGLWIYEYFCDKPRCETKKSLCAKIYVDQYDELTLGYNFLCACPLEYKCPSNIDDDDTDYETDARGTFIPKYCEPVHRGLRRKHLK